MVIWGELVSGEELIQSDKIFQHQIAKLFSLDSGNGSSTGNLGCGNKITEISE